MKSKIVATFFLFLAAAVFASNADDPAVIPLPQKMELRDGAFQLTDSTHVYTDRASRAHSSPRSAMTYC